MKALTWNLEWALPGSVRERIIAQQLAAAAADVICLTEAFRNSLPSNGEVIEAAAGNPVADRKKAKKVLLWSRQGWSNISFEEQFFPKGRIVSGVTQSAVGRITVIGVCVPWRDSNTIRLGGRRSAWEDHLLFLKSLRRRLAMCTSPTILIGDFNQRLPRFRQPTKVAEALEASLGDLVVATRGFVSCEGKRAIDHIACTSQLKICDLEEDPPLSRRCSPERPLRSVWISRAGLTGRFRSPHLIRVCVRGRFETRSRRIAGQGENH